METADLPFRLVCGDISGIQSFIYNITNKNASKSLKGRSFYIQLLADTLASELCEATATSPYSVVYTAGGKFYLLVSNTEKSITAIETYKRKMEERLWIEYEGKISVNIASVAFRFSEQGDQVQDEKGREYGIGELWRELAESTSQAKRQRNKELMLDRYDELFTPFGQGGLTHVCAVSGQELQADALVELKNYDDDELTEDAIYISHTVNQQIKLGRQLAGATAIATTDPTADNSIAPGLHTSWVIESNGGKSNKGIPGKCTFQIDFNDSIEFLSVDPQSPDTASAFRLYGGFRNATSINNGRLELKTFEELCTLEDSVSRMGVLRMDVDNLGQLFMTGLSTKDRNFAGLSTLSAAMDLFFSGHLNTIRNNDKYKDCINIIYAGGDDVFAVGHWNKLLEFAIEVRQAFYKYVGCREDLTLSAGLSIVRAKYPISKAADIAGEFEDLAKQHVVEIGNNKYEKDSLCLFGVSINWRHELLFVIEFKNDLIRWINEDKLISRGLLMKFFDYYELSKKDKIQWRWQAAYSLARQVKPGDSSEKIQVINSLKELLFAGSYKKQFNGVNFNSIIVACRWAELLTKN